MKNLLYAILIIALAGGIAFINLTGHSRNVEPVAVPSPAIEKEKAEQRVYDKGGKVLVYNSSSPEVLEQLGEIQNGTKIDVLGRDKDFYHVKYDVQGELKEGYIPTWYLDDKKAAVSDCDYGYLVLKEAREGLLYPEGPEIVDLEQGKLLKPFLESGDWVEVNIIVYDIPAVLNAWVKKTDLVSPEKIQAKEGFIPSDAELYLVEESKDIKNSKPVKESYPKSVFIKRREGGYAYVSAAGGWNAWVEEKWISYTDKDFK